MGIRVIFIDGEEQKGHKENHIQEALIETIKFFGENEKSEKEILADLIYEDFVKCR
ncbi:MAG: hypothetical protein GTO12_22110 [Proteobacteria bacterium]|nr:hypothetical protein [Pseudomonadota bacterium]